MITKKQNILITGMSGLLGSVLGETLEKSGYKIYDIDVDISNAEAVKNCIYWKKKIDWIIHTAAITDVDLCEKDRALCYKVNFEGTKNIRDLARTGQSKFIYISTASVFSGFEGNYKETDLPYPKNYYNLTKFLGEIAAAEYSQSLILRLNLIGIHPKGSRGKNFFEWLVDSIRNNNDIRLFNDVIINPLSNLTIAEIISKIIEIEPKERILHIGSKDVLSKADIGKLVIKTIGSYRGKAEFTSIDNINNNRTSVLRLKQIWLNVDYIQKNKGIKMPTLESEINKILKNYVRN